MLVHVGVTVPDEPLLPPDEPLLPPLEPLLPLEPLPPPVDGVEDDEQATTKTAERMVRWDQLMVAGAYNRA